MISPAVGDKLILIVATETATVDTALVDVVRVTGALARPMRV